MLSLVFEHTDFLVVNKPTGMPMHDAQNGIIPSAQVIFGVSKLWLVHRLDDATSGCMILAKSQQAASALSQLFERREIQKYYLAISDKKPKKKQGKIIGDMQKARNGNYKLTQSRVKPAISQFFSFPLHPLPLASENDTSANGANSNDSFPKGLRLFMVKPLTGKTHQIRVALKSLGSPILGDQRYSSSQADRLYLHSYGLSFRYQSEHFQLSALPLAGSLFESTIMQQCFARCGQPWELKWP
ncbi:pseudouridine synthase [Brumicola blandensis]|uniref:Pseudouridine synthase n=1 Tax=Brumicola blandensis TaxID=3075611 RepID=A0AAW8R0Y1_9ALTE|nr:pseudouridine synthase [Alteromonas sp. W409]MDT0582927.1 pseudouridine synthase [Alteromonas sp. W409]